MKVLWRIKDCCWKAVKKQGTVGLFLEIAGRGRSLSEMGANGL